MEDRKGDKCDPFAALSRTVGWTVFTVKVQEPQEPQEPHEKT